MSEGGLGGSVAAFQPLLNAFPPVHSALPAAGAAQLPALQPHAPASVGLSAIWSSVLASAHPLRAQKERCSSTRLLEVLRRHLSSNTGREMLASFAFDSNARSILDDGGWRKGSDPGLLDEGTAMDADAANWQAVDADEASLAVHG